MPRPHRIHLEGALNYVTSRALEGFTLFKDDRDYETYLHLLNEYRERFGFKLFAYVLLPDHLHLCVEATNGATISAIMHALNSRYTKYYNKRYGHAGHVFEGRFRLTLIEKASSLLQVTGYLHTHSRRSGFGMDVSGYRWSSCQSYLSPGARHLLEHGQAPGQVSGTGEGAGEVAEVLAQLQRRHPDWTYDQYLLSVREVEWEALRQALRKPLLGSEEFLALAKAHDLKPEEPAPQPRVAAVRAVRGRPAARWSVSPVLTASLAIAFVSLCAASLYARNMATLKQTVRTLAKEQRLLANGIFDLAQSNPGAQLASFSSPLRLNGVSVEIQVRANVGSPDPLAQSYRIEFKGGKLACAALSQQGFSPATYKVTDRSNGIVRWEAAQTDRIGTLLFWRGEWDGQAMRGELTKELPGQAASQFDFFGATRPSRGKPTSET